MYKLRLGGFWKELAVSNLRTVHESISKICLSFVSNFNVISKRNNGITTYSPQTGRQMKLIRRSSKEKENSFFIRTLVTAN
jgi:hypothetical protein